MINILKEIERCLMTSQIGSMTVDCSAKMEIEAAEETVRFLMDRSLKREVAKEEYYIQRKSL